MSNRRDKPTRPSNPVRTAWLLSTLDRFNDLERGDSVSPAQYEARLKLAREEVELWFFNAIKEAEREVRAEHDNE